MVKLYRLIGFFTFVIPNLVNTSYGQDAFKIRLLDNYNDTSLKGIGDKAIWNDLASCIINGNEYIIAGTTDSIYFFHAGPDKLKLLSVKHGISRFAQNRDFAVYSHYVYCVSDMASGIGALQIFDLNYLPDSVHKVYESNALATFVHTIFIDTATARLYLCSNTSQKGFSAMDILSLQDPESPVYLDSIRIPLLNGQVPAFSLVHEMFARGDTAYLSCGNDGLFIYDLRDVSKQKILGTITDYFDKGFNHSSSIDQSGRYIMFTDENSGRDIKIFDIKDPADARPVSNFNSNVPAIPHNAYWYGNLAFVSSYQDGVVVYDLSDPANPVKCAWYDTHPLEPEQYSGFTGCWGVTKLSGKRIAASDISRGIFLLETDSTVGLTEPGMVRNTNLIYPNPFNRFLYFEQEAGFFEPVDFEMYNATGEMILQTQLSQPIFDTSALNLEPGLYITRTKGKAMKLFKSN